MISLDIEPIIGIALSGGPKTVIGIKVWMETRMHIWVPDIHISITLDRMIRDGMVQAHEMGAPTNRLDDRQRHGHGSSMLYSLIKGSAT